MKVSNISGFFFVFTLLASVVSFGDNAAKSEAGFCLACQAKQASTPLSKILATSKNMVDETSNSKGDFIPNDPRRALDRKAHPEYNAIGIVKTDIGRGSGWLANECLVWTNKHVIGGDKKIIGNKVMFHVGQSSTPDRNFEYAVEGEVVASGNPDGDGTDSPAQDWALIKLKTSVGKKVGFIDFAQYSVEDAATCKTLEIAGFPGEKSVHDLWWQGNCPLYPENSGPSAFNLGCPITAGNSGSPLLCRETDGNLYAIGIATSARIGRPQTESFALNFTVDWPRVKGAYWKYKDTCN